MARPSKMTAKAVDAFVKATELGATRELAAQAAGWSTTTAYRYLEAGRKAQERTEAGERLAVPDRRNREFWEAVQKAEGTMAQDALGAIRRAAQEDRTWQAAAWLLERRYPEMYGRRAVEVTGKEGGAIDVSVTAEDLLAQLRKLNGREEARNEHSRRLRAVPELNGHGPGADGQDEP